jgi:hypothetical protein
MKNTRRTYKKFTFKMWDQDTGIFEIRSSAYDHLDAVEQAARWAESVREATGANVWALSVKAGWK